MPIAELFRALPSEQIDEVLALASEWIVAVDAGDVSAGASPGTLPTGPGSKETASSGPETTAVTAVTEATVTKDDETENEILFS